LDLRLSIRQAKHQNSRVRDTGIFDTETMPSTPKTSRDNPKNHVHAKSSDDRGGQHPSTYPRSLEINQSAAQTEQCGAKSTTSPQPYGSALNSSSRQASNGNGGVFFSVPRSRDELPKYSGKSRLDERDPTTSWECESNKDRPWDGIGAVYCAEPARN